MARPTKLTPETQQRICDAIRAGNYMETAAAYAGISKDTLYAWLKRGARSKSGIYREFSDALQKAIADGEVGDVARIAKAASDGVWQASAWRLERRYPDKWGRRERVEVTGDDAKPVTFRVVETDAIRTAVGVAALAGRSTGDTDASG